MTLTSDSQSSLHWILSVCSLAWTLDGKKLISGSSDGSIRIFNTATWQLNAILKGHGRDIISVLSLSWSDRLLASASFDNTARLWDLDTNLPIGPPLEHKYSVGCAAFSADGKQLVTGCEDENAYVWDIATILKETGQEDLLAIPHVSANTKHEHLLNLIDIASPQAPKDGLEQKVCITLRLFMNTTR